MTHQPGVEFSLFAPRNESVAILGSWNGWQLQPMERGDDGTWRITLPLDDGTYQYKYQVKSRSFFQDGETVTVADPCSVSVSHDSDENSVLRVVNGHAVVHTYQWQHDDKPLPSNRELIIYEMHVIDFSGEGGGRFDSVTARLDYLVSLGVNAIELMPISDYPGHYSWGYNPRFLFAVENNYGSPEDLARLVDECHARGIRVILDGVYNHGEDRSPLAQIDYEYWYHRDNPDDAAYHWGPKFNYDRHDDVSGTFPAREFVWQAINHWIQHFHIDGIRFDATAIIDDYNALRWLKERIYASIGGVKPFIMIAEHVPEDPTVAGFEGPMDAAWHEEFSKQLMAIMVGQNVAYRDPNNLDNFASALQPRTRGYQSAEGVVNYIDNHDQDRILWQLGQAGIVGEAAFRRVKMGYSLLLTAPGIPMIWMGSEFGAAHENTIDPRPLPWELLDHADNQGLRNHVAALTRLRRSHPALTGESIEIICLDAGRKLLGFRRFDEGGGVVVVVANLSDDFLGDVAILNVPDGLYHEYVFDYDTAVQGGTLHTRLAESEVKVYYKKA